MCVTRYPGQDEVAAFLEAADADEAVPAADEEAIDPAAAAFFDDESSGSDAGLDGFGVEEEIAGVDPDAAPASEGDGDADLPPLPPLPGTPPGSSSSDSDSSSSNSSSSSDSGGDVAPPVPEPDAAAADAAEARIAGPRKGAANVIFVAGGKLVCYENILVAECGNRRHGRCVLTRYLKGSGNPARSGQGRPAGYEIAWLRKGTQDGIDSKEKHWAAENEPSKPDRQAARAWLKDKRAAGDMDAIGILAAQREKRGGEYSEPDVVPGPAGQRT